MNLREFDLLCREYIAWQYPPSKTSAGYPKRMPKLISEIVARGNEILAEIEAERLLITPGGEMVKAKDLEELERIECPVCHRAVLEDEFLQCAVCEADICLYCYESETHVHGDNR